MKATAIDVAAAFGGLRMLADRTPETSSEASRESFARLSPYREGGVFIAHFAGRSEWERHVSGDELVHALEGEADLFLLVDGREVRHTLKAGQLLVVPEKTWHRFETAGVKLLTVTPQPTDHSRLDPPED